MRLRIPLSTVLVTAAVGAPAPAAGRAAIPTATPTPTAAQPTRTQISRAVHRALRSGSLWATVHICNSPAHPGVLGIRGQMPALGFPAALSMTVRLGSWSAAAHRFVPEPAPDAVKALTIGLASTGLHQDGVEFRFTAPAGPLNATVRFTWARNGRVIGQTTRRTTAGHHTASWASPPGYSAAQCQIS